MRDELPKLPDSMSLFETAPCGLMVTRENGSICRANFTFCTWLGYTEEELSEKRLQDLLTIGGKIFHQTHWSPLMQMQGSVAEVKLDFIHKDRHTVTMLINAVRRQRDGEVFHELAMFGTTDRDKYERELLAARKVAEGLLAEKTAAEVALQDAQEKLHVAYEKAQRRAVFAEQMVAIVSHDLKNPLTAIKMAAQILGRGEQSAKSTQMLGHISHSADRAERMIADLLDLALARVGRGLAVSRQPVALELISARTVSELQVTFPAANIVHHTCAQGVVDADADRVQQAIGNLVANAVTYGDPSQPVVIRSLIEHDMALISVQNGGAPIPQATLRTIFEPMTRGTETDGDMRSVGLGLFIVKEIAKAHGGSVAVESNDVDGTTFTVRLPRAGVAL